MCLAAIRDHLDGARDRVYCAEYGTVINRTGVLRETRIVVVPSRRWFSRQLWHGVAPFCKHDARTTHATLHRTRCASIPDSSALGFSDEAHAQGIICPSTNV
jgi:hypothetical protein